jgi:hypothetical protein
VTVLRAGAVEMDLAGALAQLDAEGYAHLGPVLAEEGLAALRERAEDLMLGRVPDPGLFFQLDARTGEYADGGLGWRGPSLAYRKVERLERDARFLAWIENPLFERVARARIPGGICLYRAILFNKGEPGGGAIRWHQDGGTLWGLSQEPELQVWTALDDAPEGGGCLEVVPGSHRLGLARPMGGVIPDAQLLAHDAEARAVPVPARAGDVVLLHNQLWHRSGPARPGHRRLGLSICYMSAATRCLRKKHAPREFFRVFEGRAERPG